MSDSYNERMVEEIDALGKCVSLLKAVNRSCQWLSSGDVANSLDVLTDSIENTFTNLQELYMENERKEFFEVLRKNAKEDIIEDATVELDSVIQGCVRNAN